MAFTRQQVLDRLRKLIDDGIPIIGGGAGTGISAKFEEAGGIDLLIIYNSGRFRMAGRGSLSGLMPYGDANAIVMEMAGEVLTVVEDTPVLAGVCCDVAPALNLVCPWPRADAPRPRPSDGVHQRTRALL